MNMISRWPPLVPELTRSTDIKLNKRVSLRRPSNQLIDLVPAIARVRTHAKLSRRAIIFRPAAQSELFDQMSDAIESLERLRLLGLSPAPAWAEVWHRWHVVFPRRSITGCWLRGDVLRRHDGRRWIYQKLIQPGADSHERTKVH